MSLWSNKLYAVLYTYRHPGFSSTAYGKRPETKVLTVSLIHSYSLMLELNLSLVVANNSRKDPVNTKYICLTLKSSIEAYDPVKGSCVLNNQGTNISNTGCLEEEHQQIDKLWCPPHPCQLRGIVGRRNIKARDWKENVLWMCLLDIMKLT